MHCHFIGDITAVKQKPTHVCKALNFRQKMSYNLNGMPWGDMTLADDISRCCLAGVATPTVCMFIIVTPNNRSNHLFYLYYLYTVFDDIYNVQYKNLCQGEKQVYKTREEICHDTCIWQTFYLSHAEAQDIKFHHAIRLM